MDLGSPGRIKVDKLDTETGVCWPAAKSFFSCHKSQQHLWGDRLHLVVSGRLSGRWLPVFMDNSIVHWPNCSLPSSTWSPPRAGIAGHTTMPQNIYFSPITAKKKQPKKNKKKNMLQYIIFLAAQKSGPAQLKKGSICLTQAWEMLLVHALGDLIHISADGRDDNAVRWEVLIPFEPWYIYLSQAIITFFKLVIITYL